MTNKPHLVAQVLPEHPLPAEQPTKQTKAEESHE